VKCKSEFDFKEAVSKTGLKEAVNLKKSERSNRHRRMDTSTQQWVSTRHKSGARNLVDRYKIKRMGCN